MDHILGILGLIATIVFGLWGVYLVIRKRYPGEITYYEERKINLFHSIIKNLPELKISYKNTAVDENLILIKGILINTGHKDISPEMIERPLECMLPEGSKWLTTKIISTSKNVKVALSQSSESVLTFKTGLFRCKEYIRFEALANIPGLKQLQKDKKNIKLKFKHRIADTRQIEERKASITPKLSKTLIPGLLIILLSIFALLYDTYLSPESYLKLIYQIKTTNNEIMDVTISPKDMTNLKITSLNDSHYKKIIPVNEFSISNNDLKPKIVVDYNRKYLNMLAYFLNLLMGLSIVFPCHWDRQKNKKIKEIISTET